MTSTPWINNLFFIGKGNQGKVDRHEKVCGEDSIDDIILPDQLRSNNSMGPNIVGHDMRDFWLRQVPIGPDSMDQVGQFKKTSVKWLEFLCICSQGIAKSPSKVEQSQDLAILGEQYDFK